MNQDLALLQNINQTLVSTPNANQRELAKNANVSIGLMNAVLKRFVERGWIMLKNVNARKIAYALTEQGLNELKARSRIFAKRTFALASEYNQILYGKSYIEFLIEYACEKAQVDLKKCSPDSKIAEDAFCLAGELEEEEIQNRLKSKGAEKLVDLIGDFSDFGVEQ